MPYPSHGRRPISLQALSLAWCLLASLSLAQAQDTGPRLSLAYRGNNLWSPGLSAGALWPRPAHPRWALSAQAGAYWDPGSHTATFLQAGWQYRHIWGVKTHYTFGLHPLGRMRSWLPRTYAVLPAGEVQRVRTPGRGYLAPGLSLGLEHQQRWFARLHLLTLFPYNTALLPQIHLAVGYLLSPKS